MHVQCTLNADAFAEHILQHRLQATYQKIKFEQIFLLNILKKTESRA
jgi:hypothetical protein